MNAKHAPRIHPLPHQQPSLCKGQVVQTPGSDTLGISDQWQVIHPIDAQCQLLPQLQVGDPVIFCVLDNGQVAVLHKLISMPTNTTSAKPETLELSLPGVADVSLKMNEKGIELQSGETSLLLSRDGSLTIQARNLKQIASEALRLKGETVHIN